MKSIGVIDLFCGIGGLTNGFVQEGFLVLAGFDSDASCEFAFTQNNNAKFFAKDVRNVKGEELTNLYGDRIKILVGCAPCQPFSPYSNPHKDKDKDKWSLLDEFARLVRETKPDIVSMENVPQLESFREDDVLGRFLRILRRNGYKPRIYDVYCPDYGIPQSRRRLVMLAAKNVIPLVPKTHGEGRTPYVSVRDTIEFLPKIGAGEVSSEDPFHRSRAVNGTNLARLHATKEGGGWKDWPENLLLDCHKKATGRSYASVYGRMKWDEVAPTITTHCTGIGNGRFGHPDQHRAISFREASLLQTFPKNYQFVEDYDRFNSSAISRQIGNAVPPLLGRVIAKSIRLYVEKHYS